MDIEVLVKKAKKGDKDALVKLIMAQKEEYYKLAFVYMKNKEDSLDAMSDMITILYENIQQLKNRDAFYSWSKTILVNCCKKILRDKSKFVNENIIEKEVCEVHLKEKEEQIVIEEHLLKLTDKHQEIIRLRYFLDLDYKAISDILKIPPGTVKSRLHIGLKKLEESLRGDKYERN
ncbi:sigma-70 family RNA polymerase sigma factor [Gottschalkia acidurici]|uniref:sigma-70 family RNA polymerase sigma factor n=1 Tax=Clostridium acidurici TaxID=1556 RepID=UPI0002ED5886|nr:sigma-70 family RNA polymerase sigma factor [Gottschalkia acidurici]